MPDAGHGHTGSGGFGAQRAAALAHNVRRLRLARGWSQEELAHAAGELRQALISEIENGRANPTLDTLEGVASALSCRVRDLFKPQRSPRPAR